MDHLEIKKYVIDTIKSGDKSRIQAVIKRYYEWLNKVKEPQIDLVETAKKVFNIKS